MNCSHCGKEKGYDDWIGLQIPLEGDFVFCGLRCFINWFRQSCKEALALLDAGYTGEVES